MKKQKNNLYRIFGINNVLAVLRSNKFLIHKVIIQKNGLAEKSDIILNLIKSSDVQLQLIQKQNFRKIYLSKVFEKQHHALHFRSLFQGLILCRVETSKELPLCNLYFETSLERK